RRFDSFLQPESRPTLLALLGEANDSTRTAEVVMDGAEGVARHLLISAKSSRDVGCILLACCECSRIGQV
ncbi:MAG: hypothetical protein RIA65_01445, partial [Woeseia sp.]